MAEDFLRKHRVKSRSDLERPNTLILRYMPTCGHCHDAASSLSSSATRRSFASELGVKHFVTVNASDSHESFIANQVGLNHRGGVPMFYLRDSSGALKGPYSGSNYTDAKQLKYSIRAKDLLVGGLAMPPYHRYYWPSSARSKSRRR